MREPRIPTHDEIQEIARYYQISTEDVQDWAYIAVFDNYITDSPGYAGKVIMIVWASSPSMYEVFTWDGETIRRRQPDPDVFR
ncbi:hypothetical protein KC957_01970 [Candidatus Saccharibacteria bacterium]|nr:hypothetical protein [Candidatus Saccharibacteria bacterium]